MKKNKKTIIIISLIVVAIVLIILLLTNNLEKKLIKELTNKGYTNSTSTLFVKEESKESVTKCVNNTFDCEGEAYYFNIENYLYYKKSVLKKYSILYDLLQKYDYSNNTLNYTYIIT